MLKKLRPHLTFANVTSVIALFVALGGTSAYAANTVFSSDIVDGQVKAADLGSLAVTAGKLSSGAVTNGKLGDGAVTASKVGKNAVSGQNVQDNSLTGADINEGTLVGGPGSPSGVAGGDLTGSYPNPLIRSNSLGGDEILDGSIGAADLKPRLDVINDTELIQPGGIPVDVRADCPQGAIALSGGGYWQFDSGQLAGIRNYEHGIAVTGTNRGGAEQNLTAFAICLPA
jgi:hypothetical protein